MSTEHAMGEMWPGIGWTTQQHSDGFFFITGHVDGRSATRSLNSSLTRARGNPAMVEILSTLCQEIADELQPSFIDWTLVEA